MAVEYLIEDEAWRDVDIAALGDVAVAATLDHLNLAGTFELCVLACDDARIAALNADFRGKPQPTNVLSWPSQNRAAEQSGDLPMQPDLDDPELGDIAIAFQTCAREAAEAGKPIDQHVTHLIVHGTLHLLGFDHLRDADATLMEGMESQILGKLGLPDPYYTGAQKGDS